MTQVGFLEQAPGVKSSNRAAFMLVVATTLFVALALTFMLVRASFQAPADRSGIEGLVLSGVAIMGALGTLGGWLHNKRTPAEGAP